MNLIGKKRKIIKLIFYNNDNNKKYVKISTSKEYIKFIYLTICYWYIFWKNQKILT